MTEVLDKQIHANELKLRILTTDGCNKISRCPFCLNDFQPIPQIKNAKFLDFEIAKTAIKQYIHSFSGKYPLQVYFSGGETTMYSDLISLMGFSKYNGCRVTLNTNGNFSDSLEYSLALFSDEIHFGTYEKSQRHAERAKRMNGLIQFVYPHMNESFIEFYFPYNLHMKVFNDFNNSSNGYIDFAKKMKEKFPKADLSFRHTGIQENRGPGCDGCNKTCITLKAAWIFPDGGSSPCPQLHNYPLSYPKTPSEWSKYFNEVENFHKK